MKLTQFERVLSKSLSKDSIINEEDLEKSEDEKDDSNCEECGKEDCKCPAAKDDKDLDDDSEYSEDDIDDKEKIKFFDNMMKNLKSKK